MAHCIGVRFAFQFQVMFKPFGRKRAAVTDGSLPRNPVRRRAGSPGNGSSCASSSNIGKGGVDAFVVDELQFAHSRCIQQQAAAG